MSDLISRIEAAAATAAAIGHWLDAVRVAFPLGADAAALCLGWKQRDPGMEPHRPPQPGVALRSYSKPADTVTSIPRPGEREIIEAAWRFGAPDLARDEFRPLPLGADPYESKYGLTRIYGGHEEYGSAAGSLVLAVGDGSTRWMIEAAAAQGQVQYLFRPGRGWIGKTETRTDDPSLDEDGHRSAPVPAWATPEPLGVSDAAADGHRQVWTFSQGHTFISLAQWRAKHRGGS